ncbi:MAG: response regulator [Treponema sp.]|nr:response regulator [Treponema sp.]
MKKVLLIDASPMFREFLKEKLVAEQVTVEYAVGNRDAYTKMITTLPDLIIIDVESDITSLQEFLLKKHDDPNAKKIPIIISGPDIPRHHVATLAQFAVVKYFTKPIKFDIFFESIGKILKSNFSLDTTPSIMEMHVNGLIVFTEIALGLNREKLYLLKYRLQELLDKNKINEPKIIIMMTNIKLTFIDGSNLEVLIDNILEDKRIKPKNVKILSFDTFTKELVKGHPLYKDIEVSDNMNDIINSMVDASQGESINEIVSERILSVDDHSTQESSIEMRFMNDNAEGVISEQDSGNVLKVAIVDDDVVIRRLLEKAFAGVSAKSVLFSNGVDFMHAIEDQEFDLVILDIYIPDINGFDILRTLQRDNFKAPILIYSQATMRDAVVKSLSLGAKGYLIKPQKADVIVQKAMEVLHS